MPLLNELLARVAALAALPAVVGALITALLLVASRDWRLNLIALAAQYFFVALLMTQVIRLEVAAVKALIGWLICLTFYLTEQQARALTRPAGDGPDSSLQDWFSGRLEGWREQGISARSAFAFMAAVVVGVTAYAAASAVSLPQLPGELPLVCYSLGSLGILLLGLSYDPLRVGVGLLMILSGFDLFYVALEPSLVVTGLLGSISFVIALGMAYLKAVHATSGIEERSS